MTSRYLSVSEVNKADFAEAFKSNANSLDGTLNIDSVYLEMLNKFILQNSM